jgi:YVTN family beta-propeller protein
MVYVANSDSFATSPGTVSVIDGREYIGGLPNTGKVVATIGVGLNPWGIAVDQDSDMVYVTNRGSRSVTVIDGHTNRVTATIGVGPNPVGVAVVPSTDTVYVANGCTGKGAGTVSVIDGHTNRVEATVPVGGAPYAVGVNTISQIVYVGNAGGLGPANSYQGTVSVIHGTQVLTTITIGGSPNGIGVDQLTNNVYVANTPEDEASNVALINNRNRVVLNITLQTSTANGVAVDPATDAIFVGDGYESGGVGSLSVINGKTSAEITTVTLGGKPWGVAVDPTTDRVYAANDTAPGTVSMVDFKGYPIVGGTPPPTIPTTTTTSLSSLDGTLCGVVVKSGALGTLGIHKFVVDENHSVNVASYGQCYLVEVAPNNYTRPSGAVILAVSSSLPPTVGQTVKPLTGLGTGADLYTGSEIPTVVWHRGAKLVALEYSWDLASLFHAGMPRS